MTAASACPRLRLAAACRRPGQGSRSLRGRRRCPGRTSPPAARGAGRPQRITHAGGHGAGYLAKPLVNLLWSGQAIATAETLLLARHAGIDLDVPRQALMDSAASSAFTRGNLGALPAGDHMTGLELDRCCGELTTVTALGREHDVPFELSALVARIHQRALTRYGPAHGNSSP